jgi:putative glycosyltransferase (TIGR04372 family)
MFREFLVLTVGVVIALFLGTRLIGRAMLKRIVGRLMRALPFGGRLLAVLKKGYRRGKCLLWAYTPFLRCETRAALFLCLGQVLLREDQLDDAVELLSTSIELNPASGLSHLWRGRALQRLGRLSEAADDYQAALAQGNLSADEVCLFHGSLATFFAEQGQIDLALLHYFMLLLIQRGESTGTQNNSLNAGSLTHCPPRPGLVPDDAHQLKLLIEAYDHVAESVINSRGDFDAALDIYRRKRQLQRHFAETFGLGDIPILYLPDDWVRNIGHMALLDFWAKMKHLGWRSCDRLLLLAPPQATANDTYLHYWTKHFTVVTDPNQIRPMSLLANALGNRVAGMLELPDGREKYFCEGMGVIQEEWEANGRPPLLELTATDRERGWEALGRLGVTRGAWFVSLHVRSPGFHKEGDALHQAHRNADIRSYLPAIRHIVARGGFVIRLGDDTMEPVPGVPGLIDYPHSPEKSPWMDVFLCAACRFFIGVASGLAHLPTTFGVPCALTNWVSNALPVRSRRDVFIPKLIWSDTERRYLSFEECLEPSIRKLSYCGAKLSERHLRAVDNTPDEIVDLVREMLEILGGRPQYTATDDRLQREFRDVAIRHGLVGFTRIGRSFLRKYASLLPGQTPTHRSRRTVSFR